MIRNFSVFNKSLVLATNAMALIDFDIMCYGASFVVKSVRD